MFKNRVVQILGATLLVVAVTLVTLSAIDAPVQVFIPVTGSNEVGLAQYLRSERGMPVANPNGLSIYHLSEHGTFSVTQGDLTIYYESERTQPVNWTKSSDPLFQYHQSEWFGR